MALQYEVKDVNGLDELVRPLYKEVVSGNETVYRLDVDGVKPLNEFDVVYKTLKTEREQKDAAEKKLKTYGTYTPETIQSMVDELNGLKAAGGKNPSEEYIRNMEELKRSHQQAMIEKSNSWTSEKQALETELKRRDEIIMNMKLDGELQSIYTDKGDSRMFSPFAQIARQDLEWNEDRQEFRTKDGMYNSKEWLENVCYRKYPGFLKGNISASAAEGSYKDVGYAKYFDPKSASFNKTEQAKLFRQNPDMAKELQKRFSQN